MTSDNTPQAEAVCIGETMALIRAEGFGPLTHTHTMSLGIGGAESNVAIGLTRLGVGTSWIGALGTDSLGDLVVHELRGEGVNVVAPRHRSAPTGLMIKERRTPTTQQVSYYRAGSAGSMIRPDDIPAPLIEQSRLLHLTGITPALSATARQTVEHAIGLAKRSGVTVSFDINYRSSLWQGRDAGVELRPLIAAADIVFAGLDEAALVVGAGSPDDLASRLAALGPKEIVIKLGAEGALTLVAGQIFRKAAVPVDVIDTVGAGDAFVAGYLANLLASESVEQRLALAVQTGAFACLVPGDWEGLPRRSDLSLLDAGENVAR